MADLTLIPQAEFERVRDADADLHTRLSLIADMCRANALTAVKRAGSGHLGSSFSAMDIVVSLYYHEMNTVQLGLDHKDRDIFFSSKGHDVPGLYAVLFSLGIVSQEKLMKLRRLGGLDGHPDVGVPGVEANSGSLGMGISKGRGMAWAKRYRGRGGHVFVMTGDGELQEGQNYEALQAAAHHKIGNLTVIIDHNKVQTDKRVCEIIDLGDIPAKLRDFGWHVVRCDGHDWSQLERVFTDFRAITDRPKVLIADTIKGKGISFMEHPKAMEVGKGLYRWHAGAPDDESFAVGYREIIDRVNRTLASLGEQPIRLIAIEPESKAVAVTNLHGEQDSQLQQPMPAKAVSNEFVAEAFGQALVELAARRDDIVVLDGDLSADCRIRIFESTFPDRFIENGIAEQDMVSMAGGLARQGLLPIVNSFSSFLAARANEQIYNNAGEKTKIIYACHYAGLIPAGPGKSHQSIRDISLFGALPNFIIVQPCNAAETRLALDYCINSATENCVLRLIIGPSPQIIKLPSNYHFSRGRGTTLIDGEDAILFAYGPVMLHEALTAAAQLRERNFGLKVVNMPWLNCVDPVWLRDTIASTNQIYVLEDHSPVGGLGDRLLAALQNAGILEGRQFVIFGVEGLPACGTPAEALRFHGLDGASLTRRILGSQRENLQSVGRHTGQA